MKSVAAGVNSRCVELEKWCGPQMVWRVGGEKSYILKSGAFECQMKDCGFVFGFAVVLGLS
jgi:hypothetical protein